MAITPKTKELAAIGISVAAGCKPCTDHHVAVARKARATEAEIRGAIGDGLSIRRSAAAIIEAHALADLGETSDMPGFGVVGEAGRDRALAGVGAAFAVNCVSSLRHYLAEAGAAGASPDEIAEIVKLAGFIKQRAASHVERLVGMAEQQPA